MKRTCNSYAMIAVAILIALPAAIVSAQVTLPELTKTQLASLDKSERNQYKDCTSPKKSAQAAGVACAAVADAVQGKLGDATTANAVRQRACDLGNDSGCMSYGKVLAASGDIDSARRIWNSPACSNSNGCKELLFDSYANSQPPDLARAEQYGLPLCEQFDEDQVCKRLVALGSNIDYQAIQVNRRQKKIAELNDAINASDSNIVADNEAVVLAQANADRCSGWACLLAKGVLVAAQAAANKEQANNASMRMQRDQLMAQQ
ncbi:MAG: hypothetical protein WB424_15150 [Terracidiphilus sp.]